jgi:hypothetical protein
VPRDTIFDIRRQLCMSELTILMSHITLELNKKKKKKKNSDTDYDFNFLFINSMLQNISD